jgi:hypothetical protein
MARSSRAPRVARGALAASVATFVALLSHVVAGGEMPAWAGILVPWVLAVAVSTLLAGRSLSLWRLSLAVLASQFLFHWLFVLGLYGGDPSAGSPGLHDHHMTVSTAPVVAGASGADLVMWAGHLFAALATIALVYRGERAARRLLTLAGEIVRAVRRHIVAASVGFVFVPRRISRGAVATRVIVPLGWAPSSLARRGPPLTLSV